MARYDNRDECEIAESLLDPDWLWEVLVLYLKRPPSEERGVETLWRALQGRDGVHTVLSGERFLKPPLTRSTYPQGLTLTRRECRRQERLEINEYN